MTPNRYRIRWVIADPDTGAVIAPEFAVAIDLDRLTAEQIDAATDASELDAIPADVLDEAVSLAALLADGLRWRAWMATPYNADATRGDSWQAPATVPCASCQLAGNVIYAVDVRTAVVVPWDVMGDPRAYAMVCPECACDCPSCAGCDSQETEGGLCAECFEALPVGEWVTVNRTATPEPAPNPGHVCDTCGTETPHATWHYSFTAAGQPENARTYCAPCWAESVKVEG